MFYFSGTADEALEEFLRVKDSLIAGREAPRKGDFLALEDLVNDYLHHKKQRVDSGERSERTWLSYKAVGSLLVEFFGRNTAAESLLPADWQRLRAELATRYNPVAMSNRMTVVKMIFKYGAKKRLLATPADYGDEFDNPDKVTIRKIANAKGDQSFKPAEILALLKAAGQPMRAMIFLAINGGLGPTDLALLTADKFDFERGWLNYPRPKTEQPRRVPLWKETIAAVKDAIAKRTPHKNPADANLLFIAGRGANYISRTGGDRVAHEFAPICKRAGVAGRVFYDFRRTFQTQADNLSRDADGTKAIMGHVPRSDDMSAVYRQSWFEARLRSITDRVHGWLYAKPAKRNPAAKRKTATALRVIG